MITTIPIRRIRGRIDFAVITILEEEFEAVLRRFEPRNPVVGGRQSYEYCRLRRSDGRFVTVAIVRAFDQGQSVAQSVARDVIEDLEPRWLVLVGIAGGVPQSEFSLGDVLIASSLHDFSITAAVEDEPLQLRTGGGPVHPVVARLIASLTAWRDRLGNWNHDGEIGRQRPHFVPEDDIGATCYYGSIDTKTAVRNALQSNFPVSGDGRKPLFRTGAVATANVLLKDTTLLAEWRGAARHITHVEMEAGGVYIAARHGGRQEIPLLCIRGISDIVGLKRISQWTPYACETAASFFHALISHMPPENFSVATNASGTAFNKVLSQLPTNVLRLADSVRDGWRAVVAGLKEVLTYKSIEPPTVDAIIAALQRFSSPLRQKIVPPDERIERLELEHLNSAVADGDEGEHITIVLGGPGSGKTTLLAMVADAALQSDIPTFAFKADTVPSDTPFNKWAESELGLAISALDAVRAAVAQSRVVVIVDQLDALSSTVDLRSDRLNAIIDFIEKCSKIPNVKVVCSCRSFDFHHDARFSALQSRVIELQPPVWENVSTFLVRQGIANPDAWAEDTKQLLRNPQHLQLYLKRYAETGRTDPLRSYQRMLDDLWERNVQKNEERDFLYRLTEYLMEHEELWAPLVKFEDDKDVIQVLQTKGILQALDSRIGFVHQTLLEHAKARVFTKDDRSLRDFVLERQGAVLVRPTVWAVLHYLRDANPSKYRTEIEGLFAANLRLHLRYLLIDFLGQCVDPHDYEISLMGQRILDPDDRVRALISIRGQQRWFSAFLASHFPTVMRGPADRQWPMVGVIADAWSSNREDCLGLIESNWLPEASKDTLTRQAMSALSQWDERALTIVRMLIRRTTDDGDRLFWAEALVSIISADKPEMAAEIFVETVRRIDANDRNDGKG